MIAWLFLALLLTAELGAAEAGVLTATWTPPTTNVDGSPLTNLASHRIYWYLYPNAPCPGTQFLVVNMPQTTVDLTSLTAGLTYNVAATAVNSSGQESACSNVASAPARADATAPPPPGGTPVVGAPVFGPTTVTLPVTWTPSVDPAGPVNYVYNGALDDNTGQFTGMSATPGTSLILSYHASGLAQPGWMCEKAQNIASGLLSSQSCGPITLPAKPITVPPALLPPVVQSPTASCNVTVSATPPDSTTGWSARFLIDGSTFGTVDASPPYTRSKTGIAPGSHTYSVQWMKGGTVLATSPVTVQTCP